jgi:hypothetical protein
MQGEVPPANIRSVSLSSRCHSLESGEILKSARYGVVSGEQRFPVEHKGQQFR